MRLNLTRLGFFLVCATILVACGGDSGGGGGGSGPDVALAKNGGDAQTAVVATQLVQTLRVLVTEDGNPKEDALVSWTPTVGSGSVPNATSSTAADGTASTTWTLGTLSGAQSLKAAVTGASPANVTFTATATPDVAVGIVKTSGDNQTEDIGTDLEPLQVKVVDQFDNGRSGTTINWAVTSGDATVSPPANTSSGSGTASAVVTLGATPGAVTVTATAAGLLGSPITFTATATQPAPPPTSIIISVVNFAFTPKFDTVAVGGQVRWTWGAGAAGHNIISDGPRNFTSMPAGVPQNNPFSFGPLTLNTAGNYNFHCEFHGSAGGGGMAGRVTVR